MSTLNYIDENGNINKFGVIPQNEIDKIEEMYALTQGRTVYADKFPTFSITNSYETVVDQTITFPKDSILLVNVSTYVAKTGSSTFQLYLRIDDSNDHDLVLLSDSLTTFVSGSYAVKLSAGSHRVRIRIGVDGSGSASNSTYKRGSYSIVVL